MLSLSNLARSMAAATCLLPLSQQASATRYELDLRYSSIESVGYPSPNVPAESFSGNLATRPSLKIVFNDDVVSMTQTDDGLVAQTNTMFDLESMTSPYLSQWSAQHLGVPESSMTAIGQGVLLQSLNPYGFPGDPGFTSLAFTFGRDKAGGPGFGPNAAFLYVALWRKGTDQTSLHDLLRANEAHADWAWTSSLNVQWDDNHGSAGYMEQTGSLNFYSLRELPAVPEPGSFAMVSLGLGVMFAVTSKARRRPSPAKSIQG